MLHCGICDQLCDGLTCENCEKNKANLPHTPKQMPGIIITYPDGDGELHIETEKESNSWTFKFTYSDQGDKWRTLVQAAKDILKADDLKRKTH